MDNSSRVCTCTRRRRGECHATPTTTTDAGILAIVRRQSRPAVYIPGESDDADDARYAADRAR